MEPALFRLPIHLSLYSKFSNQGSIANTRHNLTQRQQGAPQLPGELANATYQQYAHQS
jgi:hypothetical protein